MLMFIQELVPNVNLEDMEVEFKGILKEGKKKTDDDREELEWLKAICAFANTNGGTIYVGVDNQTHKILSLDHETIDHLVLMVRRLSTIHLDPLPYIGFKPIAVPNTLPTRYVLAIKVQKPQQLPVVLKYKGFMSAYVRRFGCVSVATSEELRNILYSSEEIPFDSPIGDEIFDPADFTYMFKLYESKHNRPLTADMLISVGFMDKEHHLCRGAAFFKDDCDDERTLLVATSFPGLDKGGLLLSHRETFKGNLLKELEFAFNYVNSHSFSGIKKTELGAVPTYSYPARSLTEAIANAIGHRNYYLTGSQIEVNLFRDHLDIVSPGSFVGGKWLREETNLGVIPPVRRNHVICRVLGFYNYMDTLGTGLDKIEEDYERYGAEYKPRASSDDRCFILSLADLCYSGFAKLGQAVRLANIDDLSGKHDQKVLEYCYLYSHTAKEIAEYLGIGASSYFRKNVLDRLVEKGLLFSTDARGVTTYATNKTAVHLA